MDGGQILIRSKHLNANPRESLFNELILKAEGNVLSKNKYLTSHYKSDKAMHRIFLGLYFGQTELYLIKNRNGQINKFLKVC